ncbi:hypothetical protein I302_107672 [Kwoniella bestiolae CBS 10118]|uniref:Uncharacterized protein n=1 Tax=Kwoniella bestiolae CBS 10118 TaxID=1296100 RepID=A0A1B9FXW4_9TREE|nr:hypothetical protein I302_06589 [Kwoniella bestiolae CBS 10118]OCF23606.1 hypothetical protein I302_06589 [Kwoniella bestiolae CBS 10118]
MMSNNLLVFLATLTVAYSLPSPDEAAKRGQYQPETIEVTFPAYSRYVNPNNQTDTFWGPQKKVYFFETDPTMARLSGEEFTWITYDKAKEATKLEDKDREYNMTCYANLREGGHSGVTHGIELDTKAPYIKSLSNESWEDMVKNANVICPIGECIKEGGCEGLEIPKWNQDYLKSYVKP